MDYMRRMELEARATVSRDEFLSLLDKVIDSIQYERSSKSIGGFRVEGGLVVMDRLPYKLAVIGDIHGDLYALLNILESTGLEDTTLLFLGDYGDRGLYSVEVYSLLLYLKARYPESVIMLRGNHEGPDGLPFYPHDLPAMLNSRFDDAMYIYQRLRVLFSHMYTAALIRGTMLLVHGGVPIHLSNLNDIVYADGNHPSTSTLEEILWNDPREMEGYEESARGYGYYFGKDITEHALKVTGTNIIVRSHEPCIDGYRLNHDTQVLTLFSCKEPYRNSNASYMLLRKDDIHASNQVLLERVEVF